MPATPSVADELVAHSRALRRLARDLVGRGDADDLVQDTVVRALRSPPAETAGAFAWLVTVMRRLAQNRRRDDERRRRRELGRELASADPGGVPPTLDDVAQRDAVRAVTEALWALPEPYQGTLVQRYFQDRSPAWIAERTRTPLATVKSRLQRGLELLRGALARDGRDWRAALVPALALHGHSPWLLPTIPVTSMTTLAKMVAAAAACGLAVFAWWWTAPAAPPQPGIAGEHAHAADALAEVTGTERQSQPRVAADATADALLSLAQPFAFELRCRAVDADGMPLHGARIAVAPAGCALAWAPQAIDGDGRAVVQWHGRAAAMTVAVGLEYREACTALQEVRVVAGTPAEVAFVGGSAPLPVQVRLDALGRQIVTMPDCAQGRTDCRKCHEAMAGDNVFEVRGALRAGLHPDPLFGDRIAVPPPDPREEPGDFDDITASGPGHFGVAPASPRIVGRLFAADGKPAANVPVRVYRPGVGGGGGPTQSDGSFGLGWTGEDGPVIVRAGGGPEGLATQTIELRGTEPVFVDLFLATGRTLRGRAIGADGASLNGARVEFVAAPGADGDLATVGPDGTFAFANLAPGPARLLLWGVRGEKVPIAEERDVPPDGGEVVFDLRARPPARGELRVFVRGHDDAPAVLEVRAWQQDTGRGTALDRREDGGYHLHGLLAGFYRLEVGAFGHGFVNLGTHWVDGAGLADLGTVQLPRPGRVRIEAATDPDVLEFVARRDELDVRADEVVPWTRDLLLPPGRWVALWRRGTELGVREFTLAGDASVALDR